MPFTIDAHILDSAKKDNSNEKLDLDNQVPLLKLINSIERPNDLLQIRNNQERLIQIDQYYIAKYKAQSNVLKKVIFMSCLGLVGAVLYHNKLIPSFAFTIYLGVITSILCIIIAKDVFNIFLRDNMIFDEYDYGFLTPPIISGNMHNVYNTAELSNMPTCSS